MINIENQLTQHLLYNPKTTYRFLAFFLLLLNSYFLKANENIVDLKNRLENTPHTAVEQRITIFNDLAWEYAYMNTDTALFFCTQGLQLAKKHKSKYLYPLSNSYGTLGIIYDLNGDADKALLYYLKSVELKTELNDKEGIANIKTNIGALYYMQGRLNKALDHFNESLEFEIENKDTLSQIGSLINIAVIHKQQGQLKEARNYLNMALKLNQFANDASNFGIIYGNLGAQYLVINELDSAQHCFDLAIAYDDQLNDLYRKGIALNNQANVYLRKNELQKAEQYAKQALNIGIEGNYYKLHIDALESLFAIMMANGKYDIGFTYQSQAQLLKDSILSSENKQKIIEVETKYELQENENELNKQQYLLKEEQQQSFFYLVLIITASFILLIISLFTLSKIRNNRLLAEKNSVIHKSLKEKEILMREIHHRVKNNIQAIKSIVNIQKRKTKSDETKQSLNKTINRINAMALIHSKLYQQNSIYEISSDVYLTDLLNDIIQSFGLNNSSTIINELTEHSFQTDELLTLGLIFNELITNACKYGVSQQGELWLKVSSLVNKDQFEIEIVNSKTDANTVTTGFGSDLTNALIKKINGTITFTETQENGKLFFKCAIKIPIL